MVSHIVFHPSEINETSGSIPRTTQTHIARDGEIIRKHRGLPPGSNNKPKPPLIITHEPKPAMNPFILEVSAGSDVVERIARFTRSRNTGLTVLSGSGTVSNVSLRQPGSTSTIPFHGQFEIHSLSAAFIPHPPETSLNGLSISFAGPQGQIIRGLVVGSLLAVSHVFVIAAASFNNPSSYYRLPPLNEEDVRNNSFSSDEREYSCQPPSDVNFAPVEPTRPLTFVS